MADLSLDRDEGKPTSTHLPKMRAKSLFFRSSQESGIALKQCLEVSGALSMDKRCSSFAKLTSKARGKEAEEPVMRMN